MPDAEAPSHVIDVDGHFVEPRNWLHQVEPALAGLLEEKLPPLSFADAMFGEVIEAVPEARRQELRDIIPVDDLRGTDPDEEEKPVFPGAHGGADRVAINDGQRIDLQFMIPTLGIATLFRVRRHAREHLQDFCRAYNRWAEAGCAGHLDRLVPVAITDLTDPAAAVTCLTEARDRGSRAFLVLLDPVDGKGFGHQDHEVVWAAAQDLGMMPIIHTATGKVDFDPAWVDNGRADDARTTYCLVNVLMPQTPQVVLSNLLFTGVFERYPDLIFLCEEFGLSWVPHFAGLVQPPEAVPPQLKWWLPMTAKEYLQRNVRFTPLRDQDVHPVFEALGTDSVVFASDYPHPEGSANAVQEFSDHLADADPLVRERFFSGNIGEWLDKTA
jgi:predicted TIM-barrel fold metal-dependent hydrolase